MYVHHLFCNSNFILRRKLFCYKQCQYPDFFVHWNHLETLEGPDPRIGNNCSPHALSSSVFFPCCFQVHLQTHNCPRNICAISSWKALSAFPDRKSALLNNPPQSLKYRRKKKTITGPITRCVAGSKRPHHRGFQLICLWIFTSQLLRIWHVCTRALQPHEHQGRAKITWKSP